MALRKYAWAATVLLLLGPISLAQNTSKADVAIGYSFAKSVQSPSLTANGATGSIAWNLTHWLGAVGDWHKWNTSPANRATPSTVRFSLSLVYRIGRKE